MSGRYCGEGNGNPLQYPCLENPLNRGVWWATVHGVAESDTTERLTLSTHTLYRDKWTPVQTHTLPSGVSQPHSLQCGGPQTGRRIIVQKPQDANSKVGQISGLSLWLWGGKFSKYIPRFTGLITEVMLARNLLFLFMPLKPSIVFKSRCAE